MQRRGVVLGMAGGLAGGVAGGGLVQPARADMLPVPPSRQMAFRILHSGNPVGEHHMSFTQSGDQLRVDTNSQLVVRVAGIPIFHYAVRASEYWAAGIFCGLNSQVNHNGTLLSVRAVPIPGGFAVQSTKAGNYDYTSAPGLMPLTYWNKAMLEAMILNVETGHNYPAIVTSPGWNNLATADGGFLLAQRYDVTGKLHLSVWYDQTGQWAGLQFNASGLITLQKIVS